MIGILGGMGTQAGLDFCNKLAMLNRGKSDQEYPLFMLYNKSNIPGRPESIGVQTKLLSTIPRNSKNTKKYNVKSAKNNAEAVKIMAEVTYMTFYNGKYNKKRRGDDETREHPSNGRSKQSVCTLRSFST